MGKGKRKRLDMTGIKEHAKEKYDNYPGMEILELKAMYDSGVRVA